MLSFASPIFLWALAALAAPLIVHLINRERAVLLKFPSIRYIDQSQLPQQGRRRLRDFLLLLLRLLVYAAIILALANPRWVSEGDAAAVDERAPVAVFVVDATASMAHGETANNLREALRQYAEELPAETRLGLVVVDNQVLSTVAPTRDRDAVLDAWEQADARHNRAGRPSLGLAEAARLLQGRPGKVYVFSDFQASDWQSPAAASLPPGSELELVSVRPDAWRNVSLQWAKAFPKRDGAMLIFARVRNDNDAEVGVRLWMDDPEIHDDVDIPAHKTELFTLEIPADQAPTQPKANVLGLTVFSEDNAENPYAADDTFYFWMGESAGVSVGAMVPVEEEPQKMREASFVARALQVGRESTAGQFDFNILTPEDTDWAQKIDVLYLPGAGAYFDAAAWAQAKDFAEKGGLVLVTPSKAAPKLFRGMRESGLAKTAYVGRAKRARGDDTIYRIGQLPLGGALDNTFDEDAREDLFLTDIYEYWEAKPGAGAEVLLQTESGDPLIVRESVGKGAVVISMIELDTDYTDLPLRNSFVPLLWEILGESLAGDGAENALDVGESLPPELAQFAEQIDLGQPGVTLLNGEPLAVNVARSESIAQGVVLADLRGRLMAGASGAAVSDAGESEPGEPLWPWLGALALLACILEAALAARIAQPTEAIA